MLSTTIRTAAIAVVASFSVATLAAPTVAQADPKSSTPSHEETCDKLYSGFEHWVNVADALYKQEGNGGTFKAVMDAAESTLHEAENAGCDWAARVRPTTKGLATVTPVGTLQVSREGGTPPNRVITPSGATLRVR